MKYKILVRYYNKEGINDGKWFEIVDERFNLISRHKSHELAERKIKKLARHKPQAELIK